MFPASLPSGYSDVGSVLLRPLKDMIPLGLANTKKSIEVNGKNLEKEPSKKRPRYTKRETMMVSVPTVIKTGAGQVVKTDINCPKARYVCSHPGCGKTFSTSGHVSRHERIHQNIRPFKYISSR